MLNINDLFPLCVSGAEIFHAKSQSFWRVGRPGLGRHKFESFNNAQTRPEVAFRLCFFAVLRAEVSCTLILYCPARMQRGMLF